MTIDAFIDLVEQNIQDDEVKTSLLNFANASKEDDKKAEALEQFIANYTDGAGNIDPEFYDVPAYAIDDFYADYCDKGTEIAPDGSGIVGDSSDAE